MFLSVQQPPYICSNKKQWMLSDSAGYITNSITMDTNCGSMTSPLIITVLPGQQINLTLYNFDPLQPKHQDYNIPDTECDIYAHVIDKVTERSVPICRGGARIKHAYISTNNSIELVLYKTHNDGSQFGPFIIYYKGKVHFIISVYNLPTFRYQITSSINVIFVIFLMFSSYWLC